MAAITLILYGEPVEISVEDARRIYKELREIFGCEHAVYGNLTRIVVSDSPVTVTMGEIGDDVRLADT